MNVRAVKRFGPQQLLLPASTHSALSKYYIMYMSCIGAVCKCHHTRTLQSLDVGGGQKVLEWGCG